MQRCFTPRSSNSELASFSGSTSSPFFDFVDKKAGLYLAIASGFVMYFGSLIATNSPSLRTAITNLEKAWSSPYHN